MPAAIPESLLVVAQSQGAGRIPLMELRSPAALFLAVIVFTILFATLWLLSARRRARASRATTGGRRRGQSAAGQGAWHESARRLRLPRGDGLDDDDTRDIDPSDLSPGDIDFNPDNGGPPEDDRPRGGGGRP